MKFALKCKVCNQIVGEDDVTKHILSHDPVVYFDVVPLLEIWPKLKK
jgi:hypothetical protein